MWQDIKNIYHKIVALGANLYYGNPSKKITIVGITGTDGKTTTSSLVYHILKSAGKKTAMISTVGAAIGNKKYDVGFHVTTPRSTSVQRYLKLAVDNHNKYVVLETTSHALHQGRVFGIQFAVGVITNITHEHLDYHKTYKNYALTKIKLLLSSKVAIVNMDDESYPFILSKIRNKKSKLKGRIKLLTTFGLNKEANINPDSFPFKTNLLGKFNTYNCLAAIAVCKAIGLSDESIRKGLETFKSPIGRQEVVYKGDFTIMVDFAHTPNAFEQILSELRPQVKGRIIHVFGAPSKRDTTKRPIMGSTSAKYADIIILTAEDPRGESIESINNEVKAGIMDNAAITTFGNSSRF